jgi:hypothetical protein
MMSRVITLEIPDHVERDAEAVAALTNRMVEAVLADWLERFTSDLPIEALPDARVRELAEMQLPDDQQNELSELLAHNREGTLTPSQQQRLDVLMTLYRQGLIRKANALKVAVERGLCPPLK